MGASIETAHLCLLGNNRKRDRYMEERENFNKIIKNNYIYIYIFFDVINNYTFDHTFDHIIPLS